MTVFKKSAMVALLAGLGFTGSSQAALIARGGGMVYDNVNNITWAADAKLFKTQAAGNANLVSQIIAGNGGVIHDTPNIYDTVPNSGVYSLTSGDFNTTTGAMTWWGAKAWANNLTLGGVAGWSLPTTPDAMFLTSDGYYNSGSNGINITTSQMGDLFYNQLGGVAYSSIITTLNPNYNLFTNVQDSVYWSGSEYAATLNFVYMAWGFNTHDGNQTSFNMNVQLDAWAVRPGDVAAVPLPGAVWLFGSGIIGLASFTRRKNKAANLVAA